MLDWSQPYSNLCFWSDPSDWPRDNYFKTAQAVSMLQTLGLYHIKGLGQCKDCKKATWPPLLKYQTSCITNKSSFSTIYSEVQLYHTKVSCKACHVGFSSQGWQRAKCTVTMHWMWIYMTEDCSWLVQTSQVWNSSQHVSLRIKKMLSTLPNWAALSKPGIIGTTNHFFGSHLSRSHTLSLSPDTLLILSL